MSVRLPYPVFIGLAASWFCLVVRRRVARAAAPDRRDCAAPSRGPAGPGRPGATFSAARLLSYAAGLPPGPDSCRYSRTSYVLAPMIVERVTHDRHLCGSAHETDHHAAPAAEPGLRAVYQPRSRGRPADTSFESAVPQSAREHASLPGKQIPRWP